MTTKEQKQITCPLTRQLKIVLYTEVLFSFNKGKNSDTVCNACTLRILSHKITQLQEDKHHVASMRIPG